MSDTAIRMQIPTTAERFSRQAFYAAVGFHRDVADILSDRNASQDFQNAVNARRDQLEAELLNLFRSIEPAMQEENRILRELVSDLQACTINPIFIGTMNGQGIDELREENKTLREEFSEYKRTNPKRGIR